jgi:hypothetical protein
MSKRRKVRPSQPNFIPEEEGVFQPQVPEESVEEIYAREQRELPIEKDQAPPVINPDLLSDDFTDPPEGMPQYRDLFEQKVDAILEEKDEILRPLPENDLLGTSSAEKSLADDEDLWEKIQTEDDSVAEFADSRQTAEKEESPVEQILPALRPDESSQPISEIELEKDGEAAKISVAARSAMFSGPNALPLAVEATLSPKETIDSIAYALSSFADLRYGQLGILRFSIRSRTQFKQEARAWLQATRMGLNPDEKQNFRSKIWSWIKYLGSKSAYDMRQMRSGGRLREEPPRAPHKRGQGLKPIPATQASPDEKAAWKAAESKARDTAHFETLVRSVVVSPAAEDEPECQRIAEEMMAGLEMFDSDHGIQKISWSEAAPYDALLGLMNAREPDDLPMVLSAEELAALAHIPDGNTKPHGVKIDHSSFRTLPMPNPILVEDPFNPNPGVIPIGIQNPDTEDAAIIGMRNQDLDRHMLLVGKTGSGKSELMKWLVFGAAKDNYPVVLVDPHGQLSEEMLNSLILTCPERADDIVFCDLSDDQYPVAFNPIDIHSRSLIEPTVQSVGQMLQSQLKLDTTSAPRATMFAKAALTALCEANLILEDADTKCTLLDILYFFSDQEFRQLIVHFATNMAVRQNFDIDNGPFERMGEKEQSALAMPVTRAFSMLASSDAFSAVFSASSNKLNLGRLVQNKSIILIKLARFSHQAQLGEFVGSLIVPWLLSSMDDWGRKPDPITGETTGSGCRIFVDESPRVFAGDSSVPDLLAEARKWDLGLIMAAQFLEQFDKRIIQASLNNTGSKIGLSCDPKAAGEISRAVSGGSKEVTESDMALMPNFHYYGNVQMPGDDGSLGTSGPFSAKCPMMLPSDLNAEQLKIREAIIERSRDLVCSNLEEVNSHATLQRYKNVRDYLALRLKDSVEKDFKGPDLAGGMVQDDGGFDWT